MNVHCQIEFGPLIVAAFTTIMSAATPTLEAEGLDVVLVGSFNPAIFHPEWFLRSGIVNEQDAKEAEIHDVSSQLTVVRLCGILVQCVNDRFSLATMNISNADRMQDILRQTFRLLSHTPITACGINPEVHHHVGDRAYWNKIGHTLAPKELVWDGLLPRSGMQSLTIKAPRLGDYPGETNVTVEPSLKHPPGVYVRVNYHYSLPVESVHSGAAEIALKFIESEWIPACAMARRVAEQIFSKIRPDHD